MLTVITAGGKGSRIQALAPEIPKPMIPIDGVPVLEREIIGLREQGFTEFLLTVSHLGSVIMEHFGNGEKLGVHIRYFNEAHPLGTAGALFQLRDQLTEPFLLLNADAVFDVDFNRFVAFHASHGGLVTLFTHPNDHPADSGLIVADDNNTVTEWLTKEDKRPLYYKNRVNAGLHVIDPALLDLALAQGIGGGRQDGFPVDLDRQLLKPLAGSGRMFCYDSPEYVKDMGTPERYRQVTADFAAGRVQARNLSRKQKAVFLDRDGTINRYKGFLRDISEFELLPGVAAAIRQINASGYLAIVVTNQPVVSRGEVTLEQLQEIHNKMETELGQAGAYLDKIYFCPHHPHKGYAGEVSALKFDCSCRKPKPGMLLQAAKDFNIDLEQSFMLGDSENDILAGNAAGCRSILLNGYGTAGTTGEFGQVDTLDSVAAFVKQYLCVRS